jgi:AcrR family transcriptional regulator
MQLTRSRIITKAIELLEAEGVEAVSMHRLAAELGCSMMCLYHHVPSKCALLDGVGDQVMSAIEVTPMPDRSWEKRLHAQARAFRKVARTYPRCVLAAVSRWPTSARILRPAENALSALTDAGFAAHDAIAIVRALLAYSVGSIVREVGIAPGLADGEGPITARRSLRAAEFPQITQLSAELRASDPEADFAFGLALFLQAVAARAPVSRSCAPSRKDQATGRTEFPVDARAVAS